MTALVTDKLHGLAASLAELKLKIRAALASELAGAVAVAIRDVLVVAILDRMATSPGRVTQPSSLPRSGELRASRSDLERDRWDEPHDPWEDDPTTTGPKPARSERDKVVEAEPPSVMPVAAVAVGVNVGRWWLARRGTIAAAVGFGALVTMLGLAGGPAGRAALAVLAVAADVLAAESALASA